MSISKEKSYALKDRAKELGYDIKLTHCQELVAKLEGFKSRHSLLVAEKKAKFNDDEILKKCIDDFIVDNNVTDIDIINELQSNQKIIDLKASLDYFLNDKLSESMKTLRFFEFTDDCNQTDCVVAYNLKQAKNFLMNLYGDEEMLNKFTIKELYESDIKKLKIYDNEQNKGKLKNAFTVAQREINSGEKIPFTLYCNWM